MRKAALVMVAALCVEDVSGAACTRDRDCSFNGLCSKGACLCVPQWSGSFCQRLNLSPAAPVAGKMDFNESTGENISSWGGSVVRDDSGLYHSLRSFHAPRS